MQPDGSCFSDNMSSVVCMVLTDWKTGKILCSETSEAWDPRLFAEGYQAANKSKNWARGLYVNMTECPHPKPCDTNIHDKWHNQLKMFTMLMIESINLQFNERQPKAAGRSLKITCRLSSVWFQLIERSGKLCVVKHLRHEIPKYSSRVIRPQNKIKCGARGLHINPTVFRL